MTGIRSVKLPFVYANSRGWIFLVHNFFFRLVYLYVWNNLVRNFCVRPIHIFFIAVSFIRDFEVLTTFYHKRNYWTWYCFAYVSNLFFIRKEYKEGIEGRFSGLFFSIVFVIAFRSKSIITYRYDKIKLKHEQIFGSFFSNRNINIICVVFLTWIDAVVPCHLNRQCFFSARIKTNEKCN